MSTATTPAWTPDTQRPSGRQVDNRIINEDILSNSPLLFEMLKSLSFTEQRCVLDMGRASHSSIDFFGDFKCKLYITDAISDLYKMDQKKNDTAPAWLKSLAKTLQLSQMHTTLDIIFLWSLPNYLAPHHLKALINYLLPHTTRSTRMHAYIYNTQSMPAVPANYHIKRNNKVIISPLTSEHKNCPMYHLAELHSCFKPFKVDHAVMLSSGIQEYLFST